MPEQKTKEAAAVHAGFVPLLDCAPFAIARALGFDRKFGISLRLQREVSWANIRDKLELGLLDCAQLLAPMPLAATLGLGRPVEPVIAPMVLSLNGNAITVSNHLYDEMRRADIDAAKAGGMLAASALADVVRSRQKAGAELLTFGMVYPFSAHNYDLRCWLASAGINAESDVNLIVVPPPLISNNLKAGRIDGFCVGAPWNSVSVAAGDGTIVALKEDLWEASPEKVLGVRERWAEANSEKLQAIIAALNTACQWLDNDDNKEEAARILARPEYVGVSEGMLLSLLRGRIELHRGAVRDNANVVLFSKDGSNAPDPADAVWFLTQMVRWGQVRQPFAIRSVADRVFRPDLFRAAVAGRATRPEGRPETPRRICGEAFDPAAPLAYLSKLIVKSDALDLTAVSSANAT